MNNVLERIERGEIEVQCHIVDNQKGFTSYHGFDLEATAELLSLAKLGAEFEKRQKLCEGNCGLPNACPIAPACRMAKGVE